MWLYWALSVAVLTIIHLGALFPFNEASVLSNRSRKSFVFDTARWVEQTSDDWLVSFSSTLGDWPGCSNGTESRRCRVPPPHPTTISASSSPPPHPRTRGAPPLLPSPCADCHTLFTTAGDVTHRPGCLLEYRSDNRGILFDARPCVLAIRRPAAETVLPICHGSGFVCAVVRASRRVLCNGR